MTQRWIPVTERLPENMPGNSASREVVTGYMNSDPDDVYVGIDCYYAASGEWLNTDHVLAWMELPKAYSKTAPTMKLNEVHPNIERYLEEDCYCPNEVYSVDGFFYQLVYGDADCKVVGHYKDRKDDDVTLVITASGKEHDCPILLNIWHTPEKVTGMERYDYSEENLKNIVRFFKGEIDSVQLTEADDLNKSVAEILSIADAICVN